jgi:hypothetical protein
MCNIGFSGAIVASTTEPFYTGACAKLTLVSHSSTAFNIAGSSGSPLVFMITGAELRTDPGSINLTISNTGLVDPLSVMSVSPNGSVLVVEVDLVIGKNDIVLAVYDNFDQLHILTVTLWAGNNALTVNLVNPDGSVYLEQATVTARLSDDEGVVATATTTTGSVMLTDNAPPRTILITAVGDTDNAAGVGGDIISSSRTLTIIMVPFTPPSNVDNNDFSQGAAGWETPDGPAADSSTVSLVDHEENVGPTQPTSAPTPPQGGNRLGRHVRQTVNKDLVLATSGKGPVTLTRSYVTGPGHTGVSVRYRFVTSEVPGGYFGSQFNDFYSVSIRSFQAGGQISEAASMNGLGLAAFDSSGSTAWREANLPLKCEGDIIMVTIVVENVLDGALDSQVYVDFVDEFSELDLPTCGEGGLAQEIIEYTQTLGATDAAIALAIGAYAMDRAQTVADSGEFVGVGGIPQDSFRHCLWQCQMTRTFDLALPTPIFYATAKEKAAMVGYIHEACSVNACSGLAMDLHNNIVGRDLATLNYEISCEDACINAVKSGKTMNLAE